MKFFVETLGCKVNAYESELIKEKFIEAAYENSSIQEADVIVINTCTVTNQADSKSRKLIRQARKLNSKAILVVVGCMSEYHKTNLDDIDADIIIGNKDKSKIILLIDEFIKSNQKIIKMYDLRDVSFENMKINNFEGHTRGFVKIQDGCNNFCSYCVIPFTRGGIRSKDLDVAINEVKCLCDNGYQEIVLTGIHTGTYGYGKNYDLTDLIHEISKIETLKRIRISSIEIVELTDKFLNELKINNKICDHLHIPIQSGSNKILTMMNRRYTLEEYENIIKNIRQIRPNVNITTDLIVGFPGESDKDFEETINTLKRIGFSKIHTFPYSIRTGTKASTLKQVNDTIKKNRTKEILLLSDELESAYYKKFIGQTLSVLVENSSSGFTSNYIKVKIKENVEENTLVDVFITDVDGISVNGRLN